MNMLSQPEAHLWERNPPSPPAEMLVASACFVAVAVVSRVV